MKTAIIFLLSSLTLLLFWFIPCCAQQQEDFVQEFDTTKKYILLFDKLLIHFSPKTAFGAHIEMRRGDVFRFTDEIFRFDKRWWNKVEVVSFYKNKYESNENRISTTKTFNTITGFLPVHKGMHYWFMESSKKEERESKIVENLDGNSFAFHTGFRLTKSELTAYAIRDMKLDRESLTFKYELIPQPVFDEDRFIYLRPWRMNGEIYHNFHVLFMKCKRGTDVNKIELEFGYDNLFIKHHDFVSLFRQIDTPLVDGPTTEANNMYLVISRIGGDFYFDNMNLKKINSSFSLYPGDEICIEQIEWDGEYLLCSGTVHSLDEKSCGSIYSRNSHWYKSRIPEKFRQDKIRFNVKIESPEYDIKLLKK